MPGHTRKTPRTGGSSSSSRRGSTGGPQPCNWPAPCTSTSAPRTRCGPTCCQAAHQHVWRPDAVRSVSFLVASALAWFEACHGWAAWRPRSWSWWITLANLIGSVAFGVSAVAGYINPDTGQLLNAERSNLGTFIGAVCFFAGALLLLPERTEDASPVVTAPVPSGT